MLDFEPEHMWWQGWVAVVYLFLLSQKIHTNTKQDDRVELINVRLVCTAVSYHIAPDHITPPRQGFRDKCILLLLYFGFFRQCMALTICYIVLCFRRDTEQPHRARHNLGAAVHRARN